MATAEAIKLGRDTSLPRRCAGLGDEASFQVERADANSAGLQYRATYPVGSAVLVGPDKSKAMFSDIARGDTSGLAKYAK
jgi:hypothetical protein